MLVRDVMTADPACCTAETSLPEVAKLMVEHDCGAIPVVRSHQDHTPVGIVTDRDIVCRVVAAGRNPEQTSAGEAMTAHVVSIRPDADLQECRKLMEEKQVRRIAVVNYQGACCGIVAQADVALRAAPAQAAEVVKDVSKPTDEPSKVN